MGRNDHHYDDFGRMVSGSLHSNAEQHRLLTEHHGRLTAELDHLEMVERAKMLTGKGLIVLDKANARFTGTEHLGAGDKALEAAQEEATELAYRSGCAIIYAPIAVIKPQRPVAISQPSDLVKSVLEQFSPAQIQAATADGPAPE